MPDDAALEKWLQTTFLVASTTSDADEVYQGMKPVRQPTLIYVPKSSELLLTCQHSRIDGVGAMHFGHSYLTFLTHPMAHVTFGTEPARLPPTKEELVGCPEYPPAEHAGKLKQLTADWVNIFPASAMYPKLGRVRRATVKTCK